MPKPKLKIYLETSVMSAYFDFKKQEPERKLITKEFLDNLLFEYQVFVSKLVKTELLATPDEKQQKHLLSLIKPFNILPTTDEIEHLAKRYIHEGIIRENKLADATHLAIATSHQINFLVTWNYEDLNRPHQRQKIAEFNKKQLGTICPTIVTPQDFITNN